MKTSKADLHVHCKYSDRPSEWFLRRIGAPESFMEPMAVYDACKEAGMDYVTISDHNCIRGAMEIAHLPNTFISSELTTYFPENRCKIHCLVTGINPDQFSILQEARENIYDLQQYLNQQNIIHSIAHPLFRINDRLSIELFEKLILLFNRFEGINGSRDPRACDISNAILSSLTPEDISNMANRHGINPTGSEPWKKILVGGSDDHSGLYIAGAHTVTPHAADVNEFLTHLREGRHSPAGRAGTSIRLANSLYKITYNYYSSRFLNGKRNDTSVIGAMLGRLSGDVPPDQPEPPSLRSSIRTGVKKLVAKKKKRQLSEIERLIVDEFARVLEQDPHRLCPLGNQDDSDAQNFYAACKISQQLGYTFLKKFIFKLRDGNIIESLQAISSMGPVMLGIAPYLTAFATQHKDEQFLHSLADRFPAANPLKRKSGKRAWITDTFADVNGVSHTINTLAGLACRKDQPITVITCQQNDPDVAYPHKNFPPVGSFDLPEYESIKIPFPPFLELLHFLEEERFDELIISTPGALGLSGLLAARLLGLTVKGIYHTDFPKFVQSMTDDDNLGKMTWKYMRWFYRNMETVYSPTHRYRKLLIENGFDAPTIKVLPRGVNLNDFNPRKRDNNFWAAYNLNGGFKFLYVGRVSKEKNLENMIGGFLKLLKENPHADLIIVGDGPHCEELRRRYRNDHIAFTGFMRGERLQQAYASADAFIFPSMTDTFGNAVLEAHASGLPAIVSDQGGPQEIVRSHNSGIVIDARTPETFQEAMNSLINDPNTYIFLRNKALQKAAESRWETALDLLV
ncbi:glycosyltransferase [Tichowtungia aerotolerans]|uniref:Glycosyltransferase n=1 Tax=Tichowtungia aerotolerans TaxID=2697043 RepID=A0A6P1MAB4_9BACT|nr:glycosyltransferase [Tichowtungia aerotolerans]QHI70033.1 glycosyltransferase [Tichowtungia aerotolerans]